MNDDELRERRRRGSKFMVPEQGNHIPCERCGQGLGKRNGQSECPMCHQVGCEQCIKFLSRGGVVFCDHGTFPGDAPEADNDY